MQWDKLVVLKKILNNPIYKVDLRRGLLYGYSNLPLGSLNSKGYLTVTFRYNKIRFTYPVHQIIGFMGGLDMSPNLTINHIDGNKLNNSISNLESVSVADNLRHAFKLGLIPPSQLRGTDKPNAKLNADLVREIRNRYAQKQSGIRQMARDYNVSHTTILDVVKGEIWSHIV